MELKNIYLEVYVLILALTTTFVFMIIHSAVLKERQRDEFNDLYKFMELTHGTLAEKHDTLAEKHDTLAEKHGTLAEKHDTLAEKHDTLAEKHGQFMEFILEVTDTLDENHDTLAGKHERFKTYVMKLHDLFAKKLDDLEEKHEILLTKYENLTTLVTESNLNIVESSTRQIADIKLTSTDRFNALQRKIQTLTDTLDKYKIDNDAYTRNIYTTCMASIDKKSENLFG